MESRARRSRDVSDAIAEPVSVPAGAGATESFEALYMRTFRRVYAYVASMVGDRQAAEDVTALAFERAYRRRRRFTASRGTPDAWIFGIARNAALDELRRRRRRARLQGEPEDPWCADPDEELQLALRRETVRAALATLDPRERDLIALRFAGGLSHSDIARALGISESNAGTRLHRTIEKLRKACDDTDP